jgi:membrane protein DedA with SNARE-associated domain
VEKAHSWFRRAGHWSLTFGYFIPGVRHLTAYAAGMSDLEYPTFGLFAYAGAALWASAFIGLGYLLGERWKAVQRNIDHYLAGGAIAAVILAAGYLAWRKWFRTPRK